MRVKMRPDEYEVNWARTRMPRSATTNHEAREKLRMSKDPLDRKALDILEANDAAREAAGLTMRPWSVIEAERKRQATETGTTAGVSVENGRAQVTSPKADPAGPVSLVRVPEEIADCSFPCYAEAPWPYDGEMPAGIQVTDAEVDDGYAALKPGPLGGPMPAVTLVSDERGIIGAKVSPHDGEDDIRRAAQKQMYARRAHSLREWRSWPGVGTDELQRRGTDPE